MGASEKRGVGVRIVTFYADCRLPERPRHKQLGFDWRKAIKMLERSASRFGYQVDVVTDHRTDLEATLRVGDAMSMGIMKWLLLAQSACVSHADEPTVMISPDTLIAAPIDEIWGDWDMGLLTRTKPTPIINSVIPFRPSQGLSSLWDRIVRYADDLPPESLEWGADIDALVGLLSIQPDEDCVRECYGVKVGMIPAHKYFQSVPTWPTLHPPKVPIWDFKGVRKKHMPRYSRLLK